MAMKKIFFPFLIASLAFGSLSAQTEKEVSSELKKVIMFPYEAQETRTASVLMENGKQIIKLVKLSPYIKKESVRVESDGSFSILNVNYELDYLNATQKNAEVKALQAKIDKANYQIQDEETALKILNEKIEYFEANKSLNNQSKITPENFKTISGFYMSQMADIRQEILTHERKQKVYRDSLNSYNSQMQQFSSKKEEPSGYITVVATAKAAQRATLKFSYVITKASWVSSYDIRFESVTKPLKLSYKASIQQESGLDWVNIPLSLSTAETQLSGDVPQMNPYYLQYVYVTEKPKQVMMKADATFASNMKMSAPAPSEGRSYAPQAQQGTSFTFDVAGLQTIKSGSAQNMLRFKDAEVPCTYTYKTIPKLSDKVYLMGRITNWYDMGIQNGDLNLYFQNAFIGTSYINTEQFSDTLDVSFGQDQGISVKREKIKEFTSSKLMGDSKKDNIAWRIVLKNNKNETVKVKVLDQIPISKNEDFKVDVVTLSKGVKNETNGEVEWNVELAPKQSKELILQYTVKYPKGTNLITD